MSISHFLRLQGLSPSGKHKPAVSPETKLTLILILLSLPGLLWANSGNFTSGNSIPAANNFTVSPPVAFEQDTSRPKEPVKSKPTPNGLQVDFYNGINFEQYVFSRADDQVKYQWAHPVYAQGMEGLEFSARWTGRLFVPEDGVYRIILRVDDGARLWLGGKLLIDKWYKISDQSITVSIKPVNHTAEVKLQGGRYYSLKIDYFNSLGPGTIKLYWELPSTETSHFFGLITQRQRELIPEKYLYTPPVENQPEPAENQPLARKPVKDSAGLPKVATGKKEPVSPNRTVTAKGNLPSTASSAAGNRKEPEPAPTENFDRLEEGKAVVLSHVLFEQSRYILLPESYDQLDNLFRALQKNPDMQIEISGHTDNVGEARLNQVLSEQRAQVVANYLTRKGIREDRITVRGFGGTRPVAGNTSETERARNRRVEFMIRRKGI